ncbi:MAG: single-stranded-DNA-specific exonuclease RecJ [Desulfobacterales bacterium]|nr:single-stranded-DNA-specific exonuclease RecJ [Desulfobacterales bacterium]
MKKRWHIRTPDIQIVETISNALKFSHITSSVLVNRGIISPEQALSFINVSLEDIRSPFEIKDIDIAVKRIYTAINHKEKLLVFGDYDADGITATTILFEFLTYAGANATYYIPHRKDEGYGFKTHHISEHAVPGKIKLVITVDCGSASYEAILEAKQAGIDVIVIDHHKISRNLPSAEAVINPKRHDCHSGFHELSGVGMTFCVLICLRKYMRDMGFWKNIVEPNLKTACDLVALGTVADIVPLTDENRIFVKAGLDMIRSGERPGLLALIDVCKINKTSIAEEDIAFKLAPRLNAAGRIDHAKVAVELLMEKDRDKAMGIAQSLNKMNAKRQQIELKILDNIDNYLNETPKILEGKSLVLADENWDEGVLGIVASKLVEKYFRPVVLFAIRDNIGRGSARSIPGFDLYEGLQLCSSYLDTFGGHKMAAGLRIGAMNIDSFKKAFEDGVNKTTKAEDFIPFMHIDLDIDLDDISESLIDEIEQLKPFGSGNSEPVFTSRHINVLSSDIVGRNHRRMRLNQDSGKKNKIFNAIRFNIDPGFELIDHFEKVAFQLRWNRWNGNKSIQLIIVDAQA